MKRFLSKIFSITILFLPTLVLAVAMEGEDYKIEFDSFNSGGLLSTSSSYGLEDTIGEQATGDIEGEDYKIRAGYQQVGGSYISISNAPDVLMSNISGLGGTSVGTTALSVLTDSSGGYLLQIKATSSPAMLGPGGASFSDYTPAGSDPDFGFSFDPSESVFGFSPEGDDVIARFLDNGSVCNSGTGDTIDACYDGLSTSDESIVNSMAPNHPIGATTTIRFRAGIGASKIQDAGAYYATIVLTAIPQ